NRADHTRAIVIGLHRMTSMRLHKELAYVGIRSAFRMDQRGCDFESLLWVGDEFRFNNHMIFLITWEFVKNILGQTESPIAFIIFENPWNSMRTFLIEIQM